MDDIACVKYYLSKYIYIHANLGQSQIGTEVVLFFFLQSGTQHISIRPDTEETGQFHFLERVGGTITQNVTEKSGTSREKRDSWQVFGVLIN